MQEVQPGIFRKGGQLYTLNAVGGEDVYGEKLVEESGGEFRRWDPNRSKVGAAVMKGVDLGIGKSDEVLYLGAASGTTVSHFSDFLSEGFVFAVEYSDTTARDLLKLAEARENIAPILADARKPRDYSDIVSGEVDVVFQDISQEDQVEIFVKNCEKFLKEDGIALLTVKAHSISTSRDEEEIFSEVRQKLSQSFRIVGETELDPYETEHLFLKMRWKK